MLKRMSHSKRCILWLFLCMLMSGCVDLTAQHSPLPSKINDNSPKMNIDQANIFIMRGFLGIFSRGMDTLAKRCNQELQAHSVSLAAHEGEQLARYIIQRYQQGKLKRPLILIGHSEGADASIDVARRLACLNIPVDLLVLVGPFTPNTVPPNVRYVYHLERSFSVGKVIPFMGNVSIKIMDPNYTKVEALDLGYAKVNFSTININHFNMDKNKQVQDLILAKINYFMQQDQSWYPKLTSIPVNACQQQFCQRFLSMDSPALLRNLSPGRPPVAPT